MMKSEEQDHPSWIIY